MAVKKAPTTTRFQAIIQAMNWRQQVAAKKGYEAFINQGDDAVNPYHPFADSTKWGAWQVGYECACGADVR